MQQEPVTRPETSGDSTVQQQIFNSQYTDELVEFLRLRNKRMLDSLIKMDTDGDISMNESAGGRETKGHKKIVTEFIPFQLCPKCDGVLQISTHTCHVCNVAGVIPMRKAQ